MSLSRFKFAPWIASATVLFGCGAPAGPEPPEPPVQEVGTAINEHIQDLLIAFNVQELLLFELPLKPGFSSRRIPAASCPTVDDDTDVDGDGIPDNAVFTFTGAGCTVVIDSLGTFQSSGSVHIVDSGEAPGYHLVFDDYRIRRDDFRSNDYFVIAVSGTYDVTATRTTARLRELLTIAIEERQDGETTTGTMTFDWTANFAATGTRPVDLSIPLPTGSVTVEGRTGWHFDKTAFSFTVSTREPVAFDARCREGPEFPTGEVHAVQDLGGACIRIRFQGCAIEPRVTWAKSGC